MTSLSHHGTKGMKWGVRRAENRWNKQIGDVNTKGKMTLAFHNETVSRVNRAVDDLNRSDKYRNVDMNTAHGKLKNQYEKDAHEAIMRSFEDAVRSHYGYSPSGTKRAVYNRKTDQIDIVDVAPAPVAVQHAAMPKVTAPDITLQLHRNPKGLIDSVSIVPLQHMDAYAESVLEHFGTKGMKWGVRKDQVSSRVSSGKAAVKKEVAARTGKPVVVRTKPGSGVRTVGGNKRPAHSDAISARKSEQIAKKSTLDALSNKDLQHLVTRMNLEQQYRNLAANETRTSTGEKYAHQIWKDHGDVPFKKLGPLSKGAKALADQIISGANKATSSGRTNSKKK